jgi:hypothetical protein
MPRPFRLRPQVPTENDVEAGCLTILELHSYWTVKLHAGVFKTLDGRRHIHGVKKGTPDYACLHEVHRNFLLEVKRPGADLSDDQVVQIGLLELRYRLPIVVVDSPKQLSDFLVEHEKQRARLSDAPEQSQSNPYRKEVLRDGPTH